MESEDMMASIFFAFNEGISASKICGRYLHQR